MIVRKINFKICLVIFLINIMLLSFICSNVVAQEQTKKSTLAASEVNEANVEEFFDASIEKYMKDYKIPGGTITVVKNGENIFTKGYGYANIEKKVLVDGEKTLFRIASVSKLFVWTAVMQLVEEGKVDLNEDINTYMKDIKIPLKFGKPITLLDLMNHTSGLEERAIGESVAKAEDIKPLKEYLIDHMPVQVRPSGELTAYSNYGASLAGYIVSEVSGIPFEKYVEENILKPLDMNYSSFMQPLPKGLEERISVGYTLQRGEFKPQEFEWKQSSPAGAMSASAKDIGNFIIAHLQNGTYNNKQILKLETLEEMHKRSFTNDPRVNGIAHGFMEGTINEKRILWHGGDIFHFHSALVLIPEEQVGFFISFNSANSTVAVQDAMLDFMDKFYPSSNTSEAKNAPTNGPKVEGNLKGYLGNYEPTRHEYTTLGKILGTFMSTSIKESKEKGYTVTSGLPSITSHEYIKTETDIFTPLDPRNQLIGAIVFKRDDSGNIKYMFQNNNPTTAYIKIPFYDAPMFNLGLVITCVLIFLVSIIVGIFKIIKKLRKKQKWSREETSIYILPMVGSLFSLVFIVLMGIMFSNQEIVFGLPTWSKYFFMLPWVVWALSIITLITTVRLWIKSFGTAFQRVYYTIISLAITAFSAWIIYWNLWLSKV